MKSPVLLGLAVALLTNLTGCALEGEDTSSSEDALRVPYAVKAARCTEAFNNLPADAAESTKTRVFREARSCLQAANDAGVPAHVLTAALFERFASRGQDLFQNKVLSAMRHGFGGHVEKS